MNQIIQNAVFEAVRRQPWWEKNANTIVAGVGALSAILAFVATLNLPIDERWSGLIPAVVSVLTAFAVKATPNGIQPSAIVKLERTAAASSTVLPTYRGPASVPSSLPTYNGPTSAGDYVGVHRQEP